MKGILLCSALTVSERFHSKFYFVVNVSSTKYYKTVTHKNGTITLMYIVFYYVSL
jgi:hypothetical protein